MTIRDHCCCFGYGVQARLSGLWHLARGHRLHWRDNVDLWVGITGDIWCEQCPDTSVDEHGQHVGLSIWVRDWSWLRSVAMVVCGALGHPGWKHPQLWNDDGPTDVLDEVYCSRCLRHRSASATNDDAVGQR